jgi:hypothetical protein
MARTQPRFQGILEHLVTRHRTRLSGGYQLVSQEQGGKARAWAQVLGMSEACGQASSRVLALFQHDSGHWREGFRPLRHSPSAGVLRIVTLGDPITLLHS